MNQINLFTMKAVRWQWHGRQCFWEVRNDMRFPRNIHKVVYHLSDSCKATCLTEAQSIFGRLYPDAQTISIFTEHEYFSNPA